MNQAHTPRQIGRFVVVQKGKFWFVRDGWVDLSLHLDESAAMKSALLIFYDSVDETNRRVVGM